MGNKFEPKNINVTLSVLKFSNEKDIRYSLVDKLQRDNDNTIKFSVMVILRQRQPYDEKIMLRLAKVPENAHKTRLIELKEISLSPPDIQKYEMEKPEIQFEWDTCDCDQYLRYNFANVPTEGDGRYAVMAMYINGSKKYVLDRYYVDVL